MTTWGCQSKFGHTHKEFSGFILGKKILIFLAPLEKKKSVFLACLPAGKFHFYCLPWGRSHEPGTKEDITLSQLSGFQTPSALPIRSQRQNNRKQSRPDHTAPLLLAFYWALSKTHILPCSLECICHLWPSWPHFPMRCSGTTLRAHQPHSSCLMWDYRICRVVWSVWSSALSFDLCILNHDFAVLSLPSSRVHLSHILSLLLCGENLLRLESRDYLPVSGLLPFFL